MATYDEFLRPSGAYLPTTGRWLASDALASYFARSFDSKRAAELAASNEVVLLASARAQVLDETLAMRPFEGTDTHAGLSAETVAALSKERVTQPAARFLAARPLGWLTREPKRYRMKPVLGRGRASAVPLKSLAKVPEDGPARLALLDKLLDVRLMGIGAMDAGWGPTLPPAYLHLLEIDCAHGDALLMAAWWRADVS